MTCPVTGHNDPNKCSSGPDEGPCDHCLLQVAAQEVNVALMVDVLGFMLIRTVFIEDSLIKSYASFRDFRSGYF